MGDVQIDLVRIIWITWPLLYKLVLRKVIQGYRIADLFGR